MTYDEIRTLVRDHVAEALLSGEDPANLTDDIKLVSDGIVDSLASLKLVAWLEERFAIKVEAHEVDVDHLDTLSSIANLVQSKRAKG